MKVHFDLKDPPFDKSKVVVYIAGKITDNPNWKADFSEAEEFLFLSGYEKIINPLDLADNLPYSCYAPISIACVQACDMVFALPSWKDSTGAKAEVAYAEMAGKMVYDCTENNPYQPKLNRRF